MTVTTTTTDTDDHDTHSPDDHDIHSPDLNAPLIHDIAHFPTITPRTETYVVR